MKPKIWIVGLLAAVSFAGNTGCAVQRSGTGVTVPYVGQLTPDTLSNVRVETLLRIPERSLSRRSRLIIQPMLVQGGRVAERLPIRVLDAPIHSRKLARKALLTDFRDTLDTIVQPVNPARSVEIPYAATVSVPSGGVGGRIVALLSIHACDRCRQIDTIELARIFDPTALFSGAELQLAAMEPQLAVHPDVVREYGEACIRFPINRCDIDMTLGDNRLQMETMLTALRCTAADSLNGVGRLVITGIASADGPVAWNEALARRRAEAAWAWLAQQPDITPALLRSMRIESRPEGWGPVLEAMRADAHPDTLVLAEILHRYAGESDDVAEREIRRLGSWPVIRERYLHTDRRVECGYTYAACTGTSDEELLRRYERWPESLNEEEMLRVAALQVTSAEKEKVYTAVLECFPQSYAAANNLALLLLREGRSDEALGVVEPLRTTSPQLLNTQAVLLALEGRKSEALALLETIDSLPEARYNLGLLLACSNRHEEACALLEEFASADAALAALAADRIALADDIMARSADFTPRAAYVRALIAARQGSAPRLLAHLARAVRDPHLARSARVEPDFAAYAQLPEFVLLTHADAEHETHR